MKYNPEKKYEAIPTMEWLQKKLIKQHKGKGMQAYYYFLACSRPNYDKNGNLVDMRTSEKETGKNSELYNRQKTKSREYQRGVLNVSRTKFDDIIDFLTSPLCDENGVPFKDKNDEFITLLTPIHKENDKASKSKKQTEFIVNRLDETPGFKFSKINKDLLMTISRFKNPYIVSVLAHLMWQEAAFEKASKIDKDIDHPTFCVKFLYQGFGMANPSHNQINLIKEAVLLLKGMDIIELDRICVGERTFFKLLKINNYPVKGRKTNEDEILSVMNQAEQVIEKFSQTPDEKNNIKPTEELVSDQDGTNEMEELWASRRSDNNGYYDF